MLNPHVPLSEHGLGQCLALSGNATVVRRQKGEPGGVPFDESGDHYAVSGEEALAVYRRHLERVCNIPQSAFDDLLEKVRLVTSEGYGWDYSKADNLLINTEGGKFNLVDINFRKREVPPDADTYIVAYAAHCLMDYAFVEDYNVTGSKALFNTLLEKLLAASQNLGLPKQYGRELAKLYTLAGKEFPLD